MRALVLARMTLVTATLVALALAVRFALASPDSPHESAPAVGPAPSAVVPARADPDSMARIIATRDIFRAGRAPASVRFDSRTADQPSTPPPQSSPALGLVLVGILTGPEPAALVDGIPGSESTRVLKVGERLGDYRIARIGGDSMVVSGRDTTWTFRMRTRFP